MKKELEYDIDSKDFNKLRREVSRKIGIDYSTYSKRHLRRRFHARMRVLGTSTFSEYLRYLRNEGEEIEKLKELLTVNVTRFKRDKAVWKEIKNDVMPSILDRKKDDILKRLEFWSAGCATGEESYSLAISYLENQGFKDFDCNIVATDVDEKALNFAKNGEYPPKALKNITDHEKKAYFKEKDSSWAVRSEVKKLVDFRMLDILKTEFTQQFDIILCRNLMIYFNNEAKSKLAERIVESLNKGGFLILGLAESLRPPAREKMEKYDLKKRIFRKT